MNVMLCNVATVQTLFADEDHVVCIKVINWTLTLDSFVNCC